LTLEDLGRLNEALAVAMAGKTLRAASRAKAPNLAPSETATRLMTTVWAAVRAIARDLTRGAVITEGEEFMIAQPEFQRDVAALTGLFDRLAESELLYEAVAPKEGVQPVTIGRENRNQEMWQFSVIRSPFYVGPNEAGMIALVGPTRLPYDQSIPLVRFTAQALSESLTRFFG
jgi:heat-inducible transcriptional repressor